MTEQHPPERINFYRGTKRGKVLRALTASDITFWGTDAFISVVFVLYAIQFIPGGSATHVGLAYLGNRLVNALCSIPTGKVFDHYRGHLDELWALTFASFLTGALYMWLSFATSLWQLYVVMFMLGVLSAVNLAAWRIVFYSNIAKGEYGQTVGIYQTFISIAQGLALALGGYLGDTIGFDKVVFIGGLIIAIGGLFPVIIMRYFKKPKE
jgi:MFS family permease